MSVGESESSLGMCRKMFYYTNPATPLLETAADYAGNYIRIVFPTHAFNVTDI